MSKEKDSSNMTGGGFEPDAVVLSMKDFDALPGKLQSSLFEHLTKGTDGCKFEMMGGVMPLTWEEYGFKKISKTIFRGLARHASEDVARAAAQKAKKILFPGGIDEKRAADRDKPAFDLSTFCTIALERGNKAAARAMLDETTGFRGAIEKKMSGGGGEAVSIPMLAAVAAAAPEWTAEVMKRDPDALKRIFSKAESGYGIRPPDFVAGLTSSSEWVRTTTEDRMLSLLDAVRKTGKKPGAVVREIPWENDSLRKIFLSKSERVRKAAWEWPGWDVYAASERERILDTAAKRGGGEAGRHMEMLTAALGTGDAETVRRTGLLFDLAATSAYSEDNSWHGTLLMKALRVGLAGALLDAAEEQEPGSGMGMCLAKAWVWEDQRKKTRKKGDALAFCVATGDITAARDMLRRFPDLPLAYSKAVAAHMDLKEAENKGAATASLEALLLGAEAEPARAEKPKVKKRL